MVHNSTSPLLSSSGGRVKQQQRPRIAAMESGPGPAMYRLPGTTGSSRHDPSKKQSPAYSFGARTKQFSTMGSNSCSPGPVYYVSPCVSRTGKDGTPAYSIYSRPKPPTTSYTPGPAAYRAERVRPERSRAPAYSFGLKTDLPQMKSSSSPSPNSYCLPTLLGSGIVGKKTNPSYSMTGRSKIGSFHEDLKKTPGPGSYRTVDPQVYGNKSPAYTLHIRGPLPSENRPRTPGPGAHSPEKVVISRKQSPAYSFGMKHSDYIAPYLDTMV